MSRKPQNKKKLAVEFRLLRKLTRIIRTIRFEDYGLELCSLHVHPSDAAGSGPGQHIHKFVEIHVIISGTIQVISGKRKYTASEGQFVVWPAQQLHNWKRIKQPLCMHIWWLALPDLQKDSLIETEALFNAFRKSNSMVYKTPQTYESDYLNILSELKKGELCYRFLVHDKIKAVIVSLARATLKKRARRTTEPEDDTNTQNNIIQLIDQFLKDNLSRKIHITEVAKCVSMSRRNVLRYYKNLTGITIGTKLEQLRMYKAEELVRETDLQMKAIALSCGIPDSSYFPRKFKAFFKYSPTKYRQKIRAESDTEAKKRGTKASQRERVPLQ